jgi:TPR repeat protein
VKQRITSLVAGCLLAFTLFGGATAGPYEDGEAAYAHDDYVAAMRLLSSPEVSDRADAQRWIGLMYGQGLGVKQDFAQALIWFRKAADQGASLRNSFSA